MTGFKNFILRGNLIELATAFDEGTGGDCFVER